MSIAILTRIYSSEVPYINEFIDYHCNYIKIDHIYFILTDTTNFEDIIDKKFLKKITILKSLIFLTIHVDLLFNHALPSIKEKYVFNIDVDEFIFLNKELSLKDFIKKNSSYNLFYFKWIMCPSIKYQNNSVFDIYENEPSFVSKKYGKSMAITKEIDSMFIHNMKVFNKKRLIVDTNDIFILHFSSRGLVDLISRMLSQSFKNDTVETINNCLNNDLQSFGELPSRFKAVLIQKNYKQVFNKIDKEIKLTHKINTESEKTLLKKKIKINKDQIIQLEKNINKKYYDFDKFNDEFHNSKKMTTFLANNKKKNNFYNLFINLFKKYNI